MTTRDYVEELEFDLPTKLLEELVKLFEEMPAGKLSSSSLGRVQEEQGVYQLFKNDQLVYIGKTDSDAGLKRRLSRHAEKIKSRKYLDVEQITFKAIRVYVFTAMDLESLLINYYKETGQRPSWQHSGFGSNDPGRKRDTTTVKESNFDANYPIDLDVIVPIEAESLILTVSELFIQMKNHLPYNIRFETVSGGGRSPHHELSETEVHLSTQRDSVLNFLKAAKRALGKNWQITALPGYVIIYKERAPKKYPSGTIIEAT